MATIEVGVQGAPGRVAVVDDGAGPVGVALIREGQGTGKTHSGLRCKRSTTPFTN